jgi:hypothetical protein
VELEMMTLDEAEAARRRQQLACDAPAIQVAPEWEAQWEAQQQSQTARQLPSFAQMALKGFAASGPALTRNETSPEFGPSRAAPAGSNYPPLGTSPPEFALPQRSPSCSPLAAPLTPSPTGPIPLGAPRWARMSSSPTALGMLPPAAGSGGGSDASLLRHGPLAAVHGFSVAAPSSTCPGRSQRSSAGGDDDADEGGAPPLSAGWASGSMGLHAADAAGAAGGGGKKKKKQGVTLLTNGGHRG